jgi:ABC-2 type transport system permease protein
MTATIAPAPPALLALRATRTSAFAALLLRDAVVIRKNLKEFIPRTILQPLLLVFVFTYVFPKIGQGVGGSGAAAAVFSSVLVAGVVGTAILFQGIQAVSLPLVQEFGYTREIEDRVLAPLPVWLVAVEKIVAGALQCTLAGIIVFPIATIVPATPVHLDIRWPILLTLVPLASILSGALGLMFGTAF